VAVRALKIQLGDVFLTPTDGEQSMAAFGAGAFVLGWLSGSRALATAGALAIAGVGLAVYEEAQTFSDPDLMNGFFKTDGELSATRGAEDASLLRRRVIR
jgi:hypothetical protein